MKLIATLASLGLAAASLLIIGPQNSAEPAAQLRSAGQAAAAGSIHSPVVLELFTSQGCSSCPPADRLAAQLAKDPSLLIITRPVTYWDRLGWADTLAREENTALQRAYARGGNEGAGVYTPQIVVNGRHGAVGSNARRIAALARDAAMATRPALAVSPDANGGYIVRVTGAVPKNAEMVLVALSRHQTVEIGRGENGGRSVSYTNIVRGETSLPASDQTGRLYTIDAARLRQPKADRYAVLLRRASVKSGAGPILAGKFVR